MRRRSKVVCYFVGLVGLSYSTTVVTEVLPAPGVPTALCSFGFVAAYVNTVGRWVWIEEGDR